MSGFLPLFERVCARPGMYVVSETYAEVAALVLGFDLASHGGVLAGFREWLVVRLDGGSNLSWTSLVLQVAFPERESTDPAKIPSAEQRRAIDTLLALIKEFDEIRANSGLRRIFLDYHCWLKRQQWYGPKSPDWYDEVAPD